MVNERPNEVTPADLPTYVPGTVWLEDLAEELSLDTLAGVAGVSPCYFSRLFRSSFGLPPHRFVLERRLMKARDLLQGKGHSIAEIAAMTGFSDQIHLTRLFKRQFGITPQLCRKV